MLFRDHRGDEPHELGEIGGAEELHRVDVPITDAEPEVEHGAVVTLAGATTWPTTTPRDDRFTLPNGGVGQGTNTK